MNTEPAPHPLDLPLMGDNQQHTPRRTASVTFHDSAKLKGRVNAEDKEEDKEGAGLGPVRKSSNPSLERPSQLRNRLATISPSSTTDGISSLQSDLEAETPDAAVATSSQSAAAPSESGSSKPTTRGNAGSVEGNSSAPKDPGDQSRWTKIIGTNLGKLYNRWSPSLVLENKGSIARDHLANERTYLAWLRSSLSLITVGVAVAQLFRLQTSTTGSHSQFASVARPLGGSFVCLGILFLWLGTSRYFHSQTVLSYGQFPASRGSVVLATVTV
ncbi:hypothetical protein BGW38_002145, partial [Lunasporangiospora selenospora]